MNEALCEIAGRQAHAARSGAMTAERKELEKRRAQILCVLPSLLPNPAVKMYVAARPRYLELWYVAALGLRGKHVSRS